MAKLVHKLLRKPTAARKNRLTKAAARADADINLSDIPEHGGLLE